LKTGVLPVNRAMVVRKEIARKHPWVVLNLPEAFDRANEIADKERLEHVECHLAAGVLEGSIDVRFSRESGPNKAVAPGRLDSIDGDHLGTVSLCVS